MHFNELTKSCRSPIYLHYLGIEPEYAAPEAYATLLSLGSPSQQLPKMWVKLVVKFNVFGQLISLQKLYFQPVLFQLMIQV